MKIEVDGHTLMKLFILNLMKIRPVGLDLFDTDGQSDWMKLIPVADD
jgi:hypothetical protein